jgi:protein-tyrosine phosphatase
VTNSAAHPFRVRGETRQFAVLVVCSGNICRSPIGEHVLRRAFADAGLAETVTVSSAGTGDWHVGQGAHPMARQVLAEAGYPTDHVARQISPEMVDAADLVLAADHGHQRVLETLAADPSRVHLLRAFDPAAGDDEIPDPFRLDERQFRAVLTMIRAAVPGIVDAVRSRTV